MKKIAVISFATILKGENGNNKYPYLCKLLVENGYDVTLVTSSFNHYNKTQRNLSQDFSDGYKVKLVDCKSYKKNVSLKRIFAQKGYAKNLKKYLESENFDVIICSVPNLDGALTTLKFGKKNKVPVIIDLEDLWPEAFKMAINIPLVSSALFYPSLKKANKIYKMADGVVAVSNTYLERTRVKGRDETREEKCIFIGAMKDDFDFFATDKEKYDRFTLSYIGTLGVSYDIERVIDALDILKQRGIKDIDFLCMGDGPKKDEFVSHAKEKGVSAIFTGSLPYPEMIKKLVKTHVGLNPIKGNSVATIINKAGDYAFAGLPVINSMMSLEYRNLLEDYNAGLNVKSEDALDLANKIEMLYKDRKLLDSMSKNSRALACEKFDRKVTYDGYLEIVKVVGEKYEKE